jgi:DNA-binding transcriptional MerR regulator
MKTISEVCQLLGITRKTLRGYDDIGLLHPTTTTESGYWLYDDSAIQTLLVIQILIEAGYSRKDIKGLLETPQIDIEKEFDSILETLEAKRKRIDGMINSLKTLRVVTKLPQHVLLALGKADISTMLGNKSFSKTLNENILAAAELSDEDIIDDELYTPVLYELIALGCLKNEDINSPDVKNCFASFSKCVWDLTMQDEDSEEIRRELSDISQEEFGQTLTETCQEFLEDEELTKLINLKCGDGASAFIKNVLKKYRLKKPESK